MSNTKHVLLDEEVTFNGAVVEKGEVIELTELSANALIKEGKAREATPGEATGTALDGVEGLNKPSNVNKPLSPSEDQTGAENDENTKLRKAIDDKYVSRIPELKEHAKEVDVQFAHDATKTAIIDAVMTAGKGEAVLAK